MSFGLVLDNNVTAFQAEVLALLKEAELAKTSFKRTRAIHLIRGWTSTKLTDKKIKNKMLVWLFSIVSRQICKICKENRRQAGIKIKGAKIILLY